MEGEVGSTLAVKQLVVVMVQLAVVQEMARLVVVEAVAGLVVGALCSLVLGKGRLSLSASPAHVVRMMIMMRH